MATIENCSSYSVFPALLTPPIYPLDEIMEDGTLRSNSEAGKVYTRGRFNRTGRKTWKLQYEYMPTTDKELIEDFIQTVQSGARSFYWCDPVTSTEFITNGSFGSNTNNWRIDSSGTIASVAGGVSGNCLEITRVGGAEQAVVQDLSVALSRNKRYRCSWYVKQGTAGGVNFMVYCYETGWDDRHTYTEASSSVWAYHDINFLVKDSVASMCVDKTGSDAGTMLFDEVSIMEITNEVRFVELPKFSYILNGYWNCEFAIKEV